jgi:hypothetical protein
MGSAKAEVLRVMTGGDANEAQEVRTGEGQRSAGSLLWTDGAIAGWMLDAGCSMLRSLNPSREPHREKKFTTTRARLCPY